MMKIILAVYIFFGTPVFSGTYQIEGDFDGCEYGKLYPIVGGGILECLEYNYFYDMDTEQTRSVLTSEINTMPPADLDGNELASVLIIIYGETLKMI